MNWRSTHTPFVNLRLALLLLATTITFVVAAFPHTTPAQSKSQDQSGSSAKQDKGSDPPTTRLRIEVTGPAGKPVANASIYIRFPEQSGILHKDKLAELNLKTNNDGTAKAPEIPQGKILIQVVAKGLHTYGKWYDVEKPEETVQIKLEEPPHWY
jgi:hypothetical protein